MGKWRNKKETTGSLKGSYCLAFSSDLHLLSVLSPAWNEVLLFYSLARLDFIAKHDTSGCASSQAFLCLPCCLSGRACAIPYAL